MLDRLQQSPEVRKTTDQMAAVVHDFLRDDSIPRELVEFAVCEAMRQLRSERWSSSQVLEYCQKAINHEAARLRRISTFERKAWLDSQLSSWLLACNEDR